MKLRPQENQEIIDGKDGKEPEKYTSPEIQNELLEAIALGTIRQISVNMADETADVSNKEQLFVFGGLTAVL